ncbi:MAG: hypothetical protein ACHQ1H_06240 [Nitrososphaerales archaeon]
MVSLIPVSIFYSAEAVSSNTSKFPVLLGFAKGYNPDGSGASVGLTFSHQITKGNILILCSGIVSGNSVQIQTSPPFDSLGTHFVSLGATRSIVTGQNSYARIWYGIVTRSGVDSVTLNYISGGGALFGYQLSGANVNVANFHHNAKSDNGAPTMGSFVEPYTPSPNSLVIACGGFFTLEGVGTVTSGNGYHLDATFNANNAAEHLDSEFGGVSAPFSFGQTEYYWSEVSASI